MAGRPLYRKNEGTLLAQLANRVDSLERRRPVSGHYEIKLWADDEEIEEFLGRFKFAIPFDLDKARLRYVNAYITTEADSGDVVVQVRNMGTQANPVEQYMLDTPITILNGDLDSEDNSTSPWVINTTMNDFYAYPYSNEMVFYRQQLRIDILDIGSGAMGLGVMLGFD